VKKDSCRGQWCFKRQMVNEVDDNGEDDEDEEDAVMVKLVS
jgi:hypothetical protein